jgi:hypothetical protein
MIQLYSMMWISAIFFGIVGMMRGWNRELLTLAGILLSVFALFQFDALLRGVLLASVSNDQVFFVELFLFCLILYMTYRVRGGGVSGGGPRRNRFQEMILGGLVGALNGYLIWGAVWYFLDINQYPLTPLVLAPAPGSISAERLNAIPLVLLGGAAGGSTEILTVMVIVLFLFVLFMM